MNTTQRDYIADLIQGTAYPTVAAVLAGFGCPNPTRSDAAHIIDILRRHHGYTR